MPNFNFYNAPNPPDQSQGYHDWTRAHAEAGQAASTGLLALTRFFEEKNRRDDERQQLGQQLDMRRMLAEQEMARVGLQEQGRNARADLRASNSALDRQQRADLAGAKDADEAARSSTLQDAFSKIGVDLPNVSGLKPGDITGLASAKAQMDRRNEEEQRKLALNRGDSEIAQALTFGMGPLVQDEKVRGADLYDEFKGAQGPELQAAATEMFGATNPEMQKAWLKSMTGPQQIRYLDPEGWQALQNQIGAQAAQSGVPSERVNAVAQQVLKTHGYKLGKDEAMKAARSAIDDSHNATLKKGRTSGAGDPEKDARASEDQAVQMARQDPSGLFRALGKGKVKYEELTPAQLAEAQSEGLKEMDDITKVQLFQAQGLVEGKDPDPIRAQALMEKARTDWLVRHNVEIPKAAAGPAASSLEDRIKASLQKAGFGKTGG